MKKRGVLIWVIVLIIITAVWFFWPKPCGTGGLVMPGQVIRGCDCIGKQLATCEGCTDSGTSCWGIPKYHCYLLTQVKEENRTKIEKIEISCETGRLIDFGSNIQKMNESLVHEIELLFACAKEGEIAFNDATGKHASCCSGLTEVYGCAMNEDGSCCTVKCKIGCGTICINCGDGICNAKENKCTCPADCT